MELPKRTKYVVTCGAFSEEMSAIRYAELISSKGLRATVSETDTDPTANITAAIMLIAEQLQQTNEKIDILLKAIPEPAATLQEEKKEEPEKNDIPLVASICAANGGLGAFLKTRRIALNLTRRQLAHRIGVGENQIIRYENGTTKPRRNRLVELCTILDISNKDIEQYLH